MNRTEALVRATLPEERAEELYEDAPCGYLSTLPDGMIVRVNRTFLAWTGYAPDELLERRRLQDLLPVGAKVFYETHYRPLIRMQGFVREIALDLVCADKTLLPVLVNAVEHRDSAGLPLVIRTTVFDATERRTYERELLAARRRAEQLAAVVEAAGDAILITTPDSLIQTWNAGAERLFGYSAEQARGRAVHELVVPPDRREEYTQAAAQVRNGREVHLEIALVRKDGGRLDASISLTPHLEPPGELVAISSIIRDNTERRVLEKQLQQAEQLRAVGTLAGGVAHEVNNQMTVVLGFSQFILQGLGEHHAQTSDIQRIIAAARHAATISQQLLAFSRQQRMVPQELDLAQVVARMAPALQELLGAHQSLVIGPSPGEAHVSADSTQIEQLLVHLTRNARDAMPPNGTLRIDIEHSRLTEEDARLHPGDSVEPGRYALLTVSDTGTGMEEGTLRRAFEPFFTTKPFGRGAGLGLATVYGIVKQHGGQVWATSKPGQGTTVRVYVPLMAHDSA
jgi:PAS domain S-box-containing protein